MPSANVGSPICSCHRVTGSCDVRDGRAHLVAVFADLPEVTALQFRERGHGPIVDHRDIDTADSGQEAAQTSVGGAPGFTIVDLLGEFLTEIQSLGLVNA
jgi:hypothetical protein